MVWEDIPIPTENFLTDIHFINHNEGYISAGRDWEQGEILSTIDGGITWQNDSIHEFIISGLDADENSTVHFTGFVGTYGNKNNNEWSLYTLSTYRPYDDISVNTRDEIFLVSGEAFNIGSIAKVDGDGNLLSFQDFDHDFEAIDHATPQKITACGYGQIIHSSDAGANWEALPYTGDYFKDIHFPSEDVGYICGFSGSILKTKDGGSTWSFLRDGDKLLVKDKRFNALHFLDEDQGFLVGNNGLCWRTQDGGSHWQVVKNLPDHDYVGVFMLETHAFLIANQGKLLRVEY